MAQFKERFRQSNYRIFTMPAQGGGNSTTTYVSHLGYKVILLELMRLWVYLFYRT